MKLCYTLPVLLAIGASAQVPYCPSGFRYPNAYCCARNKPFNPKNPNDGFYYNCYKRNHFGCFGKYAPWDVCCGRLRIVKPDETTVIPNVPRSQKVTNLAIRCTLGNKRPRMGKREVEGAVVE